MSSAFFASRSLRAGEQALHHRLIRAVAGHREECAADQAGPEREAFRQAEKAKSKICNLPPGRSGRMGDLRPASGNFVQQQEKCTERAENVQDELDHVRPNHGAHAAFKCIEHGEDGDNRDGSAVSRAERDAHDFSDCRDAHAFRQRPRAPEKPRRRPTSCASQSAFPKAGKQYRIRL